VSPRSMLVRHPDLMPGAGTHVRQGRCGAAAAGLLPLRLVIAVANVADAAFRLRDRQQNQPIFGGTTETKKEIIGRGLGL